MRLDAALGLALPGMGLRARRRLWEHCRVSVNGRPAEPGSAVSGGDAVLVEALASPGSSSSPPAKQPECAASGPDFLAFVKPCGLHSAHVAGSPAPSLEALLPDSLILLTRLDKATSGLVLAARSPEAAGRFRELEARGKVEKRYLAVVRGRLEAAITATGRLLVANRPVTGVLDEADPDPARHSHVEPLRRVTVAAFPGGCPGGVAVGAEALTLVRVTIRRGARHQIRAHLAHAGYPLLGEALYAPAPESRAPGCLYLHHEEVAFPGFAASCPAPWLAGLTPEPEE